MPRRNTRQQPDDVDRFLPLPASAMHIVVALAGGEKHQNCERGLGGFHRPHLRCVLP